MRQEPNDPIVDLNLIEATRDRHEVEQQTRRDLEQAEREAQARQRSDAAPDR